MTQTTDGGAAPSSEGVALLHASGVAKSYGAVQALKSADLTVSAGEAHALLGANGAGKSTVVKIITGVIDATSGSLSLNGQPLTLRSPADGYAAGIAAVFQDPALISDLTLRDNLQLTRTSSAKVLERLDAMGLSGFDLGERVADIPLPFLRMIDLARALSHEPKLLILDEITAALPNDLADKVFAVMDQHKQAGGSALFISHRLAEVIEHCDRCTVFRDGRTVASFVPREGGEQRIVATMLGEDSELAAATTESVTGDATADDAAPPATGESVGDLVSDESVVDTDDPAAADSARHAVPRLKVTDLSVGNELSSVSFEVYPGEVLGIVALEGQGQDALFNCLAGNRRPSSGTVEADGVAIKTRHPADAIKRGIALVPADRVLALLPQRPIKETLTLPMNARPAKWGPIARAKENSVVKRVVERLSIDTRAAAQSRRLSGGNQQKLTIGRWLAAGFRTLLMFDPTRGIDIGTKHQIYDLVRELATDDAGLATVFYSSELAEIRLVCDRVLVLYQGRVVTELPADATEGDLLAAMHGYADHAEFDSGTDSDSDPEASGPDSTEAPR